MYGWLPLLTRFLQRQLLLAVQGVSCSALEIYVTIFVLLLALCNLLQEHFSHESAKFKLRNHLVLERASVLTICLWLAVVETYNLRVLCMH